MGRPKIQTEIPKCPICGKDMIEQPIKCNMDVLEGRAPWHLNFKSNIIMCRKCSNSLIETLNSWFEKNNKTSDVMLTIN